MCLCTKVTWAQSNPQPFWLPNGVALRAVGTENSNSVRLGETQMSGEEQTSPGFPVVLTFPETEGYVYGTVIFDYGLEPFHQAFHHAKEYTPGEVGHSSALAFFTDSELSMYQVSVSQILFVQANLRFSYWYLGYLFGIKGIVTGSEGRENRWAQLGLGMGYLFADYELEMNVCDASGDVFASEDTVYNPNKTCASSSPAVNIETYRGHTEGLAPVFQFTLLSARRPTFSFDTFQVEILYYQFEIETPNRSANLGYEYLSYRLNYVKYTWFF